MNILRAGVAIAKSVFHVYAVVRHDESQWQAKLKRAQWLDAVCERLAWGQFVKRYVKSNKNDRVDAEAICEAMGRPILRFVALKSVT